MEFVKNNYHGITFIFLLPGNEGLKKIFGKSKDGKIRAIKISIENGK